MFGRMTHRVFECVLRLLAVLCLLVVVGVFLVVVVGILLPPSSPQQQRESTGEAATKARGEAPGSSGKETGVASGPSLTAQSQQSTPTKDDSWEQFKLKYHCVPVGVKIEGKGRATVDIGSAQTTTTGGQAQKTLWKCDDGRIHAENEFRGHPFDKE